MYKLLLVTDRQDVRQAYESITNWGQMMLRPITIIDSVEEGLEYLRRNSVDALGYCLANDDVAAMRQYVADHPSLPVFQSHTDPSLLVEEMQRTRRFLDRMHMDDSDEVFEEKVALQMLRDELMNQQLGPKKLPAKILDGDQIFKVRGLKIAPDQQRRQDAQ